MLWAKANREKVVKEIGAAANNFAVVSKRLVSALSSFFCFDGTHWFSCRISARQKSFISGIATYSSIFTPEWQMVFSANVREVFVEEKGVEVVLQDCKTASISSQERGGSGSKYPLHYFSRPSQSQPKDKAATRCGSILFFSPFLDKVLTLHFNNPYTPL